MLACISDVVKNTAECVVVIEHSRSFAVDRGSRYCNKRIILLYTAVLLLYSAGHGFYSADLFVAISGSFFIQRDLCVLRGSFCCTRQIFLLYSAYLVVVLGRSSCCTQQIFLLHT